MNIITDKMRADIIADTSPADVVAATFGITRADVLRVRFRYAMGYRPVSWRPNSKQLKFRNGDENAASETGQIPAVPVPEDPIVDTGLTLMELGEKHCRWIIGRDVDDQPRYCGEQRATGVKKVVRCYCEAHGRMAILTDIKQDIEIEPRFPSKQTFLDSGSTELHRHDLTADVATDLKGETVRTHHLDQAADGASTFFATIYGRSLAKAHQSQARH